MRVSYSGVNPGDTKKRRGWLGSAMPYPRVIPHSDGAGTVESVGDGVDPVKIGRRVWMYGAQSYRPFGTAAELVVLPAEQAIELPAGVPDEIGLPRHPRNHGASRGLCRWSSRRYDRAGPRGTGRCGSARGAARTLGWSKCHRHSATG